MSGEEGAQGAGNGGSKDMSVFSLGDLGAAIPTGSLSASDRAGLVNVLKDKLQFLAGQSSGYLESLSPKVKKRVQALQELQKQHDDIEAKFREERAALEARYQKLYAPFYAKRLDIVTGSVEVDENKTEEADANAKPEEEEKGVPEFWLTALKTNEVVAVQITERDEGALKFLKDIKCCSLDNPKGFRLDFIFDPNPYFKNSVLSKTYHMVDEDEPILERAIGTEIEWLPGKNLTQKILKKKPKKGAKNAKPVTKTEQCESFFNFFSPPQIPEDDEEDLDPDEAENLQDLMEQDYEIGSTIKEKIIPHAVSWFTGEALQGEDFDDDEEDEEEEDDEDEDDEDEEEDEDEDSEEEEESPPARKSRGPRTKQSARSVKPAASAAAGSGGEQPADCKQQ